MVVIMLYLDSILSFICQSMISKNTSTWKLVSSSAVQTDVPLQRTLKNAFCPDFAPYKQSHHRKLSDLEVFFEHFQSFSPFFVGWSGVEFPEYFQPWPWNVWTQFANGFQWIFLLFEKTTSSKEAPTLEQHHSKKPLWLRDLVTLGRSFETLISCSKWRAHCHCPTFSHALMTSLAGVLSKIRSEVYTSGIYCTDIGGSWCVSLSINFIQFRTCNLHTHKKTNNILYVCILSNYVANNGK